MDAFAEWAVPANTLLLIVLALVNRFTTRRAVRERQQLSQQVETVAEAVADTRRIAKESHNDLVEVAREQTEKVLERRYTDSPGEDHRYKRRKDDE